MSIDYIVAKEDYDEYMQIIENQKQEIEDLKEQLEYQDLWRKEYLIRISKAIEYIKMYDGKPVLRDYYDRDLLNILQGSDKEWKN